MHSLALAVALLFATDDARQFLNLAEEPRDSVIAEWKAGGKDLWVVAGMYEEEMQAAVLRKRGENFELVARAPKRCISIDCTAAN